MSSMIASLPADRYTVRPFVSAHLPACPTASRSAAARDCVKCELRSQRAFCNLTDSALSGFDAIGTQIKLPRGATLFQEAESSDSAFVICSGQVKLSCTSRDGKTLILKIASSGEVLGLGAVISGSAFEVTAETIIPTLVKKIRRDDLLTFLEHHGQASMHAAKALSEEYRSAFFDVRRLALSSSAAGRLAGVLLEFANSSAVANPRMANQPVRFTMGLTHEDLGNLAGMSRETVTRTLGKFQKERLIDTKGATYYILAPQKLADLAS